MPKTTQKLTVKGLVQGVGFRPYVKNTADRFSLCGNVKNIGGIVEIYINAENKILDDFIQYLISHRPVGSSIYNIEKESVPYSDFDGFKITGSDFTDTVPVIPPDIGVCKKCMREFYDKNNRRYSHPFISCISCGPRYSIMKKLPYDRINTTMDIFQMCEKCESEYNTKSDRRCFAQTIACNDCGPVLIYTKKGDPLKNAADDIKSGKVIAVRDIGGFHFVCDAKNYDAAEKIRKLKLRDEKPFAVMFYDTKCIEEYAFLSDKEKEILNSDARPIVLVKKNGKEDFPDNVCKNSNDIGAFLPCNPVQAVLCEICGPLIMTSGNISGEPIITKNEDMLKVFNSSEYLDGVLYHNREILTPLDDSITRVIDGKIQMIRRGRGFVPLPIWLKNKVKSHIFASGGDLKSAFALVAEDRAYVSQYFGDLDNIDCFSAYCDNIKRMEGILNINPTVFVTDMHPKYESAKFAEKLSDNTLKVQHHEAHIASVIAEHGIWGDVLGFSFDGTGYGTDKTVWGGEVFLYKDKKFIRKMHLKSIKMLGGDEISKNAKTASYCFLHDAGIDFENSEYKTVSSALDCNINTVYSSSMGRLFDAVSSILGISDYNDYEGKSAILLEIEASKAKETYPLTLPAENGIYDTASLIKQIVYAKTKADKSAVALGFHNAIADAVEKTAEKFDIKNIALSGGVFMNRILTEQCIDKLRKKGYNVYINEQVPSNDGGISLGQAYIISERMNK